MNADARLVRLQQVATFMGGGTPARAQPGNFGGGIPWVKTTDLNNGLIVRTEETLSALGLAASSCKMVPANAVLVAMYGGFKQIGRTGLLLHDSAINQALTAILPDPQELDPAFLLEWLNFRVSYWKRLAGSSRKDPNITKGDVADFPVPRVPVQQQRAAARVLATWNAAIEKTERLIAAKSKRLSFIREYQCRKPKQATRLELHSVTHESSVRNGLRLGRDAIMAVTKQSGMRPMREETIAAKIDRYKLVRPSAFAYNPMRLNIGSIAMSSFDHDVLVSPDYVVFECNSDELLPGYLNHFRRTRLWASHFESAGSGGVRVRIYYSDLGAFVFRLPALDEQKRIVALLDACTTEIATLEQYREALRRQKRGLMQKLLTANWQVSRATAR